MNIKHNFFGIFGVLIVSASIVASLLFGVNSAYAWCDRNNVEIEDVCGADNYDSMPDKRGVSYDEYKGMAQSCMDGNQAGPNFPKSRGACLDAASSCIQKSIDLNKCNGDNMATMATKTQCNAGKLSSGGGVLHCDRMQEMQEQAFNEAAAAAAEDAEQHCSISNGATARQTIEQKEACKKAVADACNSQSVPNYSDGRAYNEYGFSQYQDCLNKALKTTAKNEAECDARGGTWQQGTLPAGVQGPASYECVDKSPTNSTKCSDGSTPDPKTGKCANGTNPTGTSPGEANKTGNEGECGDARLVFFPASSIPGCSEDAGIGPIGGVLKFVMTILSVGVGIVAVGGVVYGSLLYAGARDDGGQTEQAMTIIRNVVIGVLLYIFMITILNWLVPGGVIG